MNLVPEDELYGDPDAEQAARNAKKNYGACCVIDLRYSDILF